VKRLLIQIGHQLDPHLLLVWLLTIPAILPLVQPTLTGSADGLLHLYRVVALDHALSQGATIFPRWLPDLAYGYGLPLFVFYAPLSYYITLTLTLLGLDTIAAFNASFMLAGLLAGSGAYLFVKEHFGPKAGLLAGVAYVYAPFHILNALARGSLPATWAMALFPFVFWIFARLIRYSTSELPPILSLKSSALVPLSSLLFSLALLTHNTLSLLFVPLLGLYLGLDLLVRWLRQPTFNAKRAAFHLALPLILGFGSASFFLIPAIFEKEFVHIQRVITPPDFDFHNHFVSLTTLFSLPQPANTGLLNPDFPLTLGLIQVGLALVGLIGLLNYYFRPTRTPKDSTPAARSPAPPLPRSSAPLLTFTVLALAGAIFMMLPISVDIWERLPLLAFVQFPHRLLGPAAIVLAVLAGAAVVTWPERFSFGLTLLGIILIFATSVPLLYPRYHHSLPAEPTLPDMMTYEHASGVIGTTSFGEYLPVWVKQIPTGSPLESMYQADLSIERLDRNALPPDAVIQQATYKFNQADLVITSPEPYRAVFHTFFFPGWTAQIDGQPSPITPVSEQGLIGVDMPAGRHRLELHFQDTPLRRMANFLSVGTWIIILFVLITSLTYGKWSAKNITQHAPRITPVRFTRPQLALLTGLAIILIITKLLYFDRFDTPLKHTFNGTTVTGADVSMPINFGEQVNLLGYDLDRLTVKPGQPFNLTLYWQARQPAAVNYSALAHLIDSERHLYAGHDNLHPGSLPATKWQPWGFVKDPHTILVPYGTPPGDYFLATGLYEPTTWTRLPVRANGDAAWGDIVVIPITVARALRSPTLAELAISWPVEQDFGVELRLLGATPERDVFRSNDFLRIAIFWEALRKPTTDYKISMRLVTVAGESTFTGEGDLTGESALTSEGVLQATGQPSHNRYPTTRWTAGERVRDNHAIWIPADFPPGTYRLQVQVVNEAGQVIGAWVDLGTIRTAE
jgi:hypothetical protein